MKSRNGGAIGPKVRYYRHAVGVVKSKKRLPLKQTIRGLFVLALLAGTTAGLFKAFHNTPLQRSDGAPAQITIKESETKDKDLISTPKQAVEDASMAAFVQKQIDQMPKNQKWSVWVRDLKSERMVSVNADDSMASASLYKLFLLPSLESKLPAKNWNSRMGKQTITDCVIAMIKVSDNDCGEAMGNYIGWQYLDKFNSNLGFTKTKVGNNKQQTTAREVGDMMYRLQNSQILSDKARRTAFDAFYAQKYRQGIPTGCGSECLVGNKTGEDGAVKHDVAVVTHNSAKYVVVIMSENAGWNDVATVAKTVDQALLP